MSTVKSRKPAKQLEELTGVVSRIAYAKESDSGWFVIVQLEDGKSVKGNANPDQFVPGVTYRFFGKWGKARGQYPPSFGFEQFTKQEPHNRFGVIQYLIRYAAGIGPVYAAQLWDEFGSEAVKTLRTDPEAVAERCEKIPVARIKDASQALRSMAATEDTRIDLTNLLDGRRFSRTLIDTLIQKWGIHAAAVVRRDPFTLMVNKFPSCGFDRCDALYKDLGLPLDRLKRQLMCLWREFQEDSNGHTWFPIREADQAIRKHLSGGVEAPNWQRAVKLGIRAGWLRVLKDDNGQWWVTEARKADNEEKLASRIVQIATAAPSVGWPFYDDLEGATDHQKEIARKACNAGPIAILGGTPGTGKTTLAAIVIRELAKRIGPESIAVCAPTGKAAVRIEASLAKNGLAGIVCCTIHRLLCPQRNGHDGDGWGFHHNSGQPLPYSLVVIDESSMKDVDIAACLFDAIRPGTLVLMIGDTYQLPPVGHGAVLRDVISSKVAGYGELTEVIRNDGAALKACRLIKDGGRPMPSIRLALEAGENWHHRPSNSPGKSLAALDQLISQVQGVELDDSPINPIWDIQVIVALNDKGELNRKDVSKRMQAILNPNGERVEGVDFRVGDKVLCTENCVLPLMDDRDWQGDLEDWESRDDKEREDWPGEPVANGELGEVIHVDKRWFVVRFNFPSRIVLAPLVGRGAYDGNFQLGYAITFHKSQGSQWPIVILLIDRAADRMASRELWYTGISRFETLVITIGDLSVLHRQCKRVALKDRKTFLAERIRKLMEGHVPF